MGNPWEKAPGKPESDPTCKRCNGTGKVKDIDSKGNPSGTKTCPDCNGKGTR